MYVTNTTKNVLMSLMSMSKQPKAVNRKSMLMSCKIFRCSCNKMTLFALLPIISISLFTVSLTFVLRSVDLKILPDNFAIECLSETWESPDSKHNAMKDKASTINNSTGSEREVDYPKSALD